MYGGVWPLVSRAAVGSPGCEKWGFSFWAYGQETAYLPSSTHLLTVPGGLALGAQPWRFQNGIRFSTAGGREGAGRGGGPAFWAVLRRALASSCLFCECGSGWVSPWWNARLSPAGPGDGVFSTAASQCLARGL